MTFTRAAIGNGLCLFTLLCGCGERGKTGSASPSSSASALASSSSNATSGASAQTDAASAIDGGAPLDATPDSVASDAAIDGATDGGSLDGALADDSDPKMQLSSTKLISLIWEKPTYESQPLGYFRAGMRIRRTPEPIRGRGVQPCGGEWFAVEPQGFVCEGKDGVTADLTDARVVSAGKNPPKDEPLPYGYGMSHGTPFYTRAPTAEQQKQAEGDVADWRRQMAEIRAKTPPEKLPPETALPITELPSFLENNQKAPTILPYPVGKSLPTAGYAVPSTRLAFLSAFNVDDRTFYLTTEHLVVPADRIKAARASEFRGVELASDGEKGEHLPFVWVRHPPDKMPVTLYKLEGDVVTKLDFIFPAKAHASVLAADVTIKGTRFYELVEPPQGFVAQPNARYAVKAADVTKLEALKEMPPGVKTDEVWIDVDLYRQTLTLYRGLVPTFATMISSGAGAKHGTPTGTFRVYQKHWTTRMHGDEKAAEKAADGTANGEGEHAYRFDDVPWVQYIFNGIAFHASFWHDGFGMPRSHGCINLSPADARYLFKRTLPILPEGWHGVNAARGGMSIGTVAVVHG